MILVSATGEIGLLPETFKVAFPFHLALNRGLKLQQIGASLQRIVPGLLLGADFAQAFQIIRPDDAHMAFDSLAEASEERFFLIEHVASGLQLRGAFVLSRDKAVLVFLGSPWLRNDAHMQSLGIQLTDFALHDPMADLLMARKAEEQAERDLSRLNDKLVSRLRQLQDLRATLDLALSVGGTTIWDYDLVSGRVSISEAWKDIVGPEKYSATVKIQSLIDLLLEEDRPAAQQAFTAALKSPNGTFSVNFRVRREDETTRWIALHGKSIQRNEQGQVLRMLGVNIDITERKESEERLRETQKLEAIGQLTGGLAHDFNNLLGIVVGNLDEIGDRLPEGDAGLRHQHRAALDAALRGVEVTRSLLSVARRQPLAVGFHDLNALVSELVPLLRSSAGSAVKLRSDLAAGELRTKIDAGGLSNAMLNLVINARDAMQGQAGEQEIMLRSRRVLLAAEVEVDLPPGAYALLEVSDTGGGMSEQIRARAFEPFFTTKGHRGTGLGLAMVYGYATQLGGTARIRSQLGLGTTIQLYLPMDSLAEAAIEAAEALRLAALQGHALLDTAPEAAFDALVAQAARICGTPISLVSLIDADRQWFKAKVGLEASQTPREQAFCAHAIADPDGMLVVTDTHTDARFSGNPLVLGEPRVRFYAGIALRGAGGDALGTLCVIDHEPRKLNAVQLIQLEALAEQVSALIQSRVPHDPRPGPTQPWAEARTPASPVAQASSLRLLVVDDEKALCELACEWFESMGYRTSSALSAAAALELLAAEPFDILFTDIVMPGMMDGLALAKEARLHYPNLRVVLASGYAQALGNDSDLPGSLVSKPYRKADLIKALA